MKILKRSRYSNRAINFANMKTKIFFTNFLNNGMPKLCFDKMYCNSSTMPENNVVTHFPRVNASQHQ